MADSPLPGPAPAPGAASPGPARLGPAPATPRSRPPPSSARGRGSRPGGGGSGPLVGGRLGLVGGLGGGEGVREVGRRLLGGAEHRREAGEGGGAGGCSGGGGRLRRDAGIEERDGGGGVEIFLQAAFIQEGLRESGGGGGGRVPNPHHSLAMPSLVESSEGGDEGESLRYEEMEDDNVSPTDLSELLKDGTKESHDRAENTQFVKDFLKGRIKKELFKLATVALYFTYSALEEEMDRNKDNPVFAPLYFPLELHRKEALIKDMKYFYGEDWKEKIQCSEATQHYVDRIHHVGQHEPELLVAHAYTRYMGDLSGGQVLKKVAQRALKLPSTDEGIQFYVFENVSNAQQFKQLYRARLNALDLDKSCKERIVEEANRAFRFNMQVFDELDKIGKSLTEEAQEGGLPVHDGRGDLRKCPYYADKLGKAAPGCPYHAAMAMAKQPLVQLILAACVAVAAGAAAWYMM